MINNIYLENKIYLRENNEFIFKIDFNNKKFTYILKEKNLTIEDNVICSFHKIDNIYNLKYKIDEEEKNIIIQIL